MSAPAPSWSADTVGFIVDYPPLSTNMAYKLTSRGGYARMYLTSEAQDFKKLCAWAAKVACPKHWPLDLRYKVQIEFFFKDARPDSDGPLKLVLDSLQGVIYNNDRQVDEVHYHRFVDRENPRVVVHVSVREP